MWNLNILAGLALQHMHMKVGSPDNSKLVFYLIVPALLSKKASEHLSRFSRCSVAYHANCG